MKIAVLEHKFRESDGVFKKQFEAALHQTIADEKERVRLGLTRKRRRTSTQKVVDLIKGCEFRIKRTGKLVLMTTFAKKKGNPKKYGLRVIQADFYGDGKMHKCVFVPNDEEGVRDAEWAHFAGSENRERLDDGEGDAARAHKRAQEAYEHGRTQGLQPVNNMKSEGMGDAHFTTADLTGKMRISGGTVAGSQCGGDLDCGGHFTYLS